MQEEAEDTCIGGTVNIDSVLSDIPHIKDNFGHDVLFSRVMVVPMNLSYRGRDFAFPWIYCKDMISPHNTILQGKGVELLSECMGTTTAGQGYRREVRQLFCDASGVESDVSVPIVIGGDTLEFRITPDNLLLCFIWRGEKRNHLSFKYFMDRTCTTYHHVDAW